MSRASSTSAPHLGRVGQRGLYLTIRVTGALLAVLALGHYGLTHIVHDVADTDAAFITDRWSSALWIVWDGLLLGTALLHAVAGVSTVIRDHRPDAASAKRWILVSVGVTTLLFITGVASLTYSVIGKI